ncbi:MAG: hypothetical protein FD161_1210 [Limisphaerales bacterium]|nr:MAG: hypothetical protein FD161_1210 [Limisphaerales bacterium]TXT49480.1 MAG: hypothetical protein FD140_3012 [Limisphaerales bacterium]
MSAVLTPPALAARKCLIGQVLGPQMLALLERVPRNPQVRALVLKLAGKLPPPECETFEQVKEWIETHCEPRKVARSSPPAARRVVEEGIRLTVRFSDTEYGRADYSVRRHAREEFHLDADDLMELVRTAIENGDSLDEIVEAAARKIDDDAWELCDPSMDDTGDYDYSNHDVSDTQDCETTFDRGDLRRVILAFLRERHPELAAEL